VPRVTQDLARGDTIADVRPARRHASLLRLAASLVVAAAAAPRAAFAQSTGAAPPATPPSAAAGAQPAAPSTPAAGTPGGAPGAREGSGASLRDAQEHLLRGLEHFRARRFIEAIHEFQLANSAAPSADLWYNIANAYEQANQPENAVEYYRRYLRDKVDPPDRADVERRITELQRLADQQRRQQQRESGEASVQFEISLPPRPAGTAMPSLFIDNRPVGQLPLPASLTLPPGPHEVRLEGPGIQEWHGTIRARPGDPTIARITALRPTQYRTRAGSHLLSYIVGGLGVVSFGIGGYYGITAASMPALDMTGGLNGARHDSAVTADVFFGIGAGLLMSAVIAWFIEAGSSRTERVEGPAGPPVPVAPVGTAAPRTATAASAPSVATASAPSVQASPAPPPANGRATRH
jgi:hypothetical protein